jgi:hypothetical protein
MTNERFLTHSRGTFAILRWAPLVAAVVLPFTFAHGPVPPTFFVGAFPIAAAWLASLLLAWRTRRQSWFGLGFVALVFGPRYVGVHGSEVPLSQFVQWLLFVIILTGIPLLLFRARLSQFARLN